MLKNILFFFSLLISLYIYLFYRTEKTLVNELVLTFVEKDDFISFQDYITKIIPLNHLIIYSLPEGLWVFCITLTSKVFFLRIKKMKINLSSLPLIFVAILELFQYFRFINGRFDLIDILISLIFWFIGMKLFNSSEKRINIKNNLIGIQNLQLYISYIIVYFAHVCTTYN